MVSMIEMFGQGWAVGEGIAASRDRTRAKQAAIEKYGNVARDPGLFTAIQDVQFGAAREGREVAQEGRAAAQEQRAAETFDIAKRDTGQAKQQQAVLGMVNGLRAARDRGEDVGAAFDNIVDTLPSLGVNPDDIPGMRQAVVDNPAVLDDYLAALGGGAAPAKAADLSEKEQARAIMNDPGASEPDKAWAASIMGGKGDAGAAAAGGDETVNKTVEIAQELLTSLDKLEKLGSVKSDKLTDPAQIVGRGIKTSAVGRMIGDIMGTDAATERQTMDGLRKVMLGQFAQNPDLSSRMFDSNAEKEMWLEQFGRVDMSVEAQRRLINAFVSAATGGRKLKMSDLPESEGDESAPAPATTQIYPGYVNPNTGARFKGGDWQDESSWEMP